MQEVLDILENVGAILPNDHFVGTSGAHIDTYINKDALFPFTKETSEIGKLFAKAHKDIDVEVVVGPAMGGIILAQWTAHHLTQIKGKQIFGVYAEKKDGELTMTRGYDKVVRGKNVLVVEDLTTTGGSLVKAIEAVKQAGGNIVACSVMVNKNTEEVTEELFSVPFKALAEYNVKAYTADNCQLCKDGIKINTAVGHGKKFLEGKK
jgi:orotate phosphoribosyltransferase